MNTPALNELQIIPSIIKKFSATKEWPSVLKTISSRSYKSPDGYADHATIVRDLAAFATLAAYMSVLAMEEGIPLHAADGNLYAALSDFVQHDSPQYWINEDLAQSLVHTDLPDDLSMKDLEIPLGAFLVHVPTSVLPSGFLVISYGEYKVHKFPGKVPVDGDRAFGDFPNISFAKNPEASRVIRVGTFVDGIVYGTRWTDVAALSTMVPPCEETGNTDLFKKVVNLSVNLLVWMNSHHAQEDGSLPENTITNSTVIGKIVKGKPFFWSPTWLGAGFKACTGTSRDSNGRLLATHWRRGHKRGVWSGPRPIDPATGKRAKGNKVTVIWVKPVRIN